MSYQEKCDFEVSVEVRYLLSSSPLAENGNIYCVLQELNDSTLKYKVMMGKIPDDPINREEVHSADQLKDLDPLFFAQLRIIVSSSL